LIAGFNSPVACSPQAWLTICFDYVVFGTPPNEISCFPCCIRPAKNAAKITPTKKTRFLLPQLYHHAKARVIRGFKGGTAKKQAIPLCKQTTPQNTYSPRHYWL